MQKLPYCHHQHTVANSTMLQPPANTASASPVQGKATNCRRKSYRCSFFFDTECCVLQLQPAAGWPRAVAGIRGCFCVSAPASPLFHLVKKKSKDWIKCHKSRHLRRVLSMKVFLWFYHRQTLSRPSAHSTAFQRLNFIISKIVNSHHIPLILSTFGGCVALNTHLEWR